MAVYKIFPEKDTFICSEKQFGNAGKDEIIELGGYPTVDLIGRTNRILIQFPNDEIQHVITNLIGNTQFSASLNLYLATASEIPLDYRVYTYPVYTTQSLQWQNGIGKFDDSPVNTTGVSWRSIEAGSEILWLTGSFPSGVTGSYQSVSPGGGNWYVSSNGENVEVTQSFTTNSTQDLSFNVTNIITQFYNNVLENRGFIIKLDDSLEFNTTSSIRLKYFGVDTNTIYPPELELKWDDQIYNTGSLPILSTDIAHIGIINNKHTYTTTDIQRFRLLSRPKYPVRTFTTSSVYLTNYALPSSSLWGVKDENTEEMVINFDNDFTKISCDNTGGYFDVYMQGLQPERLYRILIQTTLNESTLVIDSNNVFKVVR